MLDTNILSELMRPAPAPNVIAWLDRLPADRVWSCAIVRAEIELGVARLSDGQRKRGLLMAARAMFEEDFADRCLPFDESAAIRYAAIVDSRLRHGRPISVEDAQIAAIALTHRLTLATRNGRDFASIDGLDVVNPWMEPAG
nr:type II toxin-antitoxin system VapC family toxin [Thiorhodococcus mannitoliphagus]